MRAVVSKGESEEATQGCLQFEPGSLFDRGPTMWTGQADVKSHSRGSRDLIVAGRATPGSVVSERVPLEEPPEAYVRFDTREDGYSRVVLDPSA